MTILSTFMESSLNFVSNVSKKHNKIWYSQEEKSKVELPETSKLQVK